MKARIAYYRVSTKDQSIEAQRAALGGSFDKEFSDEGVSGAIPAEKRPGFAEMMRFVREGDSLHVYDVSRLGRDAIDVQTTVRKLLDKGVSVDVHGLGTISRGVGELILAVLAQVADMERQRITERCESGREVAKASLAKTGVTHRGKTSLGRPKVSDEEKAPAVRLRRSGMSYSQIAERLGISKATALRYCEDYEAQRKQAEQEGVDLPDPLDLLPDEFDQQSSMAEPTTLDDWMQHKQEHRD